jgi:hypothetical protein
MQLVEAGKIELDAPVQRYLPWFRVADHQASAQMTVRHLLNQTSGLPTQCGEIPLADFDPRPDATERQARALATVGLTRPVGAAFEYSNANYLLLGLIIEAASGEAYADYIQTHILTPLEMRHTYTSPALAKQNGLAMGHRYWFGLPVAAPNMPVPYGSLPAGLLISCAEDMAHYLIACLNRGRYRDVQILSAAGIHELQRGAAEVTALGASIAQYGMGWFISDTGPAKTVWHSGTLPDFAAHMALLPEHQQGVVLFINANHHMMVPVFIELGMGVAALLAGQQPGPSLFGFTAWIPWLLRALLIIPLLQIASVVATLRQVQRWRRDSQRPGADPPRAWPSLLPLLPNLLAALTLRPMLGKRGGYLRLYMPDLAWTTLIGGSFGQVWSFWYTRRFLKARRALASPTAVEELNDQ